MTTSLRRPRTNEKELLIIKKKNDIKKWKTLKHKKLTEVIFVWVDGSLGDILDSEDICDYSSTKMINSYYAAVIKKFGDYDRKYVVSINIIITYM